MRYKHPRARATMTMMAALATAVLASACGGSGGGGGSGFSLGGAGGQDGDKAARISSWHDTYAPVSDLSAHRLSYVGGDAATILTQNHVIVAGNIEYQNGHLNALVTWYTRSGQLLTHEIYHGEGTLHYFCEGACAGDPQDIKNHVNYSFNHVKAAAPTPAGGIVIVGTSNNQGAVIEANTDAKFAIKYGPSGNKIWKKIWKRCSTNVPCDAQAYAVAVGPNGKVFVSGNGTNTLGTQLFQVQALGSTRGDFLWHDTRGFSQLDHGYDLLVRTEKDGVYLYATEPKNNYVHKYRVSGGVHLWAKQLPRRIVHIESAADGKNLLLFSADGSHIYKVTPAGKTLWTYKNAYPGEFKAVDIHRASKQVYVATEFVPTGKSRTHTYVYALDVSGKDATLIWQYTYNSKQLARLDRLTSKINLDLSKTSDYPVAISRLGNKVLVVINTSTVQVIGSPNQNLTTVLTLGAQHGEFQHNTSVRNVALYSAAFTAKHNGLVFASGQTLAPRALPVQTKQVTARLGILGCGKVKARDFCLLNW